MTASAVKEPQHTGDKRLGHCRRVPVVSSDSKHRKRAVDNVLKHLHLKSLVSQVVDFNPTEIGKHTVDHFLGLTLSANKNKLFSVRREICLRDSESRFQRGGSSTGGHIKHGCVPFTTAQTTTHHELLAIGMHGERFHQAFT